MDANTKTTQNMKLTSEIFEEHTDIIVKDNRDTYYGHKICLTGGASNLILDCIVLEGNPADTDLVEQMLDRQKQIYDRYQILAEDHGHEPVGESVPLKQMNEIV